MSISGVSYPENASSFYQPVFHWMRDMFPELRKLELEVRIGYMNAGSIHCLLRIIDVLREAAEQGCDIRVVWYYQTDYEGARDLAEEFREDAYFPFELVPIQEGGQR